MRFPCTNFFYKTSTVLIDKLSFRHTVTKSKTTRHLETRIFHASEKKGFKTKLMIWYKNKTVCGASKTTKKIKSKERRESETRRRRREEKVIDCGFFICENLDSAPYTTKNSSHRLCFRGDLEETVSSFGCTIGGLRPATTTRSLPKTFLAINVRSFSLR